jgi:hypothetical protein
VQTMGNRQNRTVSKVMTNCSLNQFISPEMHTENKILTFKYQRESAKVCRHLKRVHKIMARLSNAEIL